MKTRHLFLILSFSILALTACTPATPVIPPASGPAANIVTVIRVGTGDSGEGLNPHQQIIQQFEDQNPSLLIQLEPVAGRDYYARLLTQLAAKAAPDLMQVGDDAVPSFVSKGAFVDLETYMKKDNFDPTIYLPGLLDPGKVNGKQYMLPKDYSPLGVYYNKKLFDDAKVAYPKDGWTRDDLLKTAQALTKDTDGDGKTDIWGLQLPGAWTTGFEYWVGAAGGQLISSDGKKFIGQMDSQAVIRAMQFYADLYNKYKVAPPPTDLNQFGGGNQEFQNGQAAMYLFGRWPEAGLKNNPNITLGVAPPPQDKVRANVLFWGGFGISSTAKNPEAAWKFLKDYAGEMGAQVWKDWALPAVKSVAETSGLIRDPIEGVWIGELVHLVPRAYTFTPYWNETADPALRKALETVILDPKADVAKTMQKAAQEAQKALDGIKK